MNVSDCRLIDLPKFLDKRGNLSFAEEFKHIPFKIERTYWIYDVPGGEKRGGHAYKENQEFISYLNDSGLSCHTVEFSPDYLFYFD